MFMSFWIYEEYLNNQYLQIYVNGFLQGGFLTAVILISIGAFTIVAMALYAKLRGARKELEGMRSTEKVGPDGRRRGQSLDTRTEQHLIEMIRKTQPIMDSGSGSDGGMPVLRRVDSQSSSEEQGSS
jgi:hypothetical protein